MVKKRPGPIEKIILNQATFANETIYPTLINFFYGNNGTGKSTIARVIAEGAAGNQHSGVVWDSGEIPANYDVLVFNREFVDSNIADYGLVKGVFTIGIGEENIAIEAEVAEKTVARAEQDRLNTSNRAEKAQRETERKLLLEQFYEACWERSKTIRTEFPDTQDGVKRNKADFANKLLRVSNPVEHDLAALRALYGIAFDTNAVVHPELKMITASGIKLDTEEQDLLAKPITSSEDSSYSQFLNAIKATDWVQQGHSQFAHKAGDRCPYCEQPLPANFEEQLANCFDIQYQNAIGALKTLQTKYSNLEISLMDLFHDNLANPVPFLDTKLYAAKAELLGKTIQNNISQVLAKIKEPSLQIVLDDLSPLIDEINQIIDGLNVSIRANNDIVNAGRQSQHQCSEQVWELLAHNLDETLKVFRRDRNTLDARITELTGQIDDGEKTSEALKTQIAELNKKVASTADTVNNINKQLLASGFQGFTIRAKRSQPNHYEIVRHDGQVADRLSEGERNFIAFLYFYHLVRGSHASDDVGKDKIVVIDDPVSSMDSSALFIVASLVKELVAVCYNNAEYRDNQREVSGDYIKQIFILTHNVYFHLLVTHNQIRHYHCVSLYLIKKAGNVSTVNLCTRPNPNRPSEDENYNPIQNTYAALWSEFKEVSTSVPMMNVIRRILEYYFLQLCGYDGMEIRKRVLEDHKGEFVIESAEGGQPDYSRYHLADSMLNYMTMSNAGISDGFHFVEDAVDTDLHREVFKLIFDALDQDQHYAMMTGEKAPEVKL